MSFFIGEMPIYNIVEIGMVIANDCHIDEKRLIIDKANLPRRVML